MQELLRRGRLPESDDEDSMERADTGQGYRSTQVITMFVTTYDFNCWAYMHGNISTLGNSTST